MAVHANQTAPHAKMASPRIVTPRGSLRFKAKSDAFFMAETFRKKSPQMLDHARPAINRPPLH